jgi:hypothetical protein
MSARLLPILLGSAVLAAAAPAAPAASGQTATEAALKAAFLVNFARFTDWPADSLPAGAPLTVCVADSGVADALAALLTAEPTTVGGYAIAVRKIRAEDVSSVCAVVYVSQVSASQRSRVLGLLAGTTTLSVTDSEEFMQQGGVIYLYLEDGQMRFVINTGAAERSHLRLSSKLLSLARLVRG